MWSTSRPRHQSPRLAYLFPACDSWFHITPVPSVVPALIWWFRSRISVTHWIHARDRRKILRGFLLTGRGRSMYGSVKDGWATSGRRVWTCWYRYVNSNTNHVHIQDIYLKIEIGWFVESYTFSVKFNPKLWIELVVNVSKTLNKWNWESKTSVEEKLSCSTFLNKKNLGRLLTFVLNKIHSRINL